MTALLLLPAWAGLVLLIAAALDTGMGPDPIERDKEGR